MPRAVLLACAFAAVLGCEPAVPPSPPSPSPTTPVAASSAGPRPWSLKDVEAMTPEGAPPLIEACAAGALDDAAEAALVQRLADRLDARGEACFLRVLAHYRPDVTEETITLASRAVAALKLRSASRPLLEVFKKLHASRPAARSAYRPVHDAMIALLDPSWEPELIAVLGRPTDPKDADMMRDEIFWQLTAAEVLGLMKSANAVRPLLRVLLSPAKADAAITCLLALVKIGKPAIAPAVALLRGEDRELVAYSKAESLRAAEGVPQTQQAAESAHVGMAALVLATLGREEVTAPLLAALDKADDVSRAIIARELTKVPRTPEVVRSFERAFEKTPVTLTIPPGLGAREVLLEQSSRFFDASLVPWLIKSVQGMKGEEADLEPLREAALAAALKLATVDQMKLVDQLAGQRVTVDGKPTTVGKGFEKERKLTKDLLAACRDKLDCYLDKMADPASQAESGQFVGIKSAYMVGALGNADARRKIVDLMPKLTSAAVRFVAVSALDALSPRGDADLASALQKIVDDGEASKDAPRIAANAPFKAVIYRLNARAQ